MNSCTNKSAVTAGDSRSTRLRDVKRTKILTTIGPATSSKEAVKRLIENGVNVFRLNFSYGDPATHEEYLLNIRSVEAELGVPVAVSADLCGPKIRVGMLTNDEVILEAGNEIRFVRDRVAGNADRLSTTFPELVDAVRVGEQVLLFDGRLKLEVIRVDPPREFACRVLVGGRLSSGKGVNLPDTDLSLSALTEKDRDDVAWIAKRDFNFVALSFVQHDSDIRELRNLLEAQGSRAQIIAKIEKPKAVECIDAIIEASDAIMVARGDLGVEMDYPSVPITQKTIARKCQFAGKPCIIATEMLESMISSDTPTRAEVSDIANAVFDHTDAVMLSAETSIGKHPVEAVRVMARTVLAAEDYQQKHGEPPQVTVSQPLTTAALVAAVRQITNLQEIAAVAMYTQTGTTARLIAKSRPACPILALAGDIETVRRCCLYFGVVPRHVEKLQDTRHLLNLSTSTCKQLGLAKLGDRILVMAGHPIGVRDHTNGLIVDLVR